MCELLGELDGCVSSALLLMDNLEIALVIAELNLLLQLLAGLLVAKVIAGSLSVSDLCFSIRPRRSLGGSAFPSATAGADGGRVGGLFDALPGRFYS